MISDSNHPTPFLDSKTSLYGYQNSEGKVVVAPQYNTVYEFNRYGIAAVADNTGWRYIDTEGKTLLYPFIYDNGPDYFCQGLARFVRNGKIGFMDSSGSIVVEAVYDFALPFSQGFAPVCIGCRTVRENEHSLVKGGKWGYINKEGSMVIPAIYEKASPFCNDKAVVTLRGHSITITVPSQEPQITGRFTLKVIFGNGEEQELPLPLLPHKTEIATVNNAVPFIRQDGIYCSRDGLYAEGRCQFSDDLGCPWLIKFSAEPLVEKNRSVLSVLILKQDRIQIQTDFSFTGKPCDVFNSGVSPFCFVGLPLENRHDFSVCLDVTVDRES